MKSTTKETVSNIYIYKDYIQLIGTNFVFAREIIIRMEFCPESSNWAKKRSI